MTSGLLDLDIELNMLASILAIGATGMSFRGPQGRRIAIISLGFHFIFEFREHVSRLVCFLLPIRIVRSSAGFASNSTLLTRLA